MRFKDITAHNLSPFKTGIKQVFSDPAASVLWKYPPQGLYCAAHVSPWDMRYYKRNVANNRAFVFGNNQH